MAKTYGALKRAEEEKGLKAEIPPVTDVSEERELSSPPFFGEFPRVQMLPALPKRIPSKNLSLLVEEFQRMKHRIIHSGLNQEMKAILFSSPGPGEGTSTVLIHFALTLAAEGDRVLLVDGNMRNPYIHQAFHLPRENGLTEMVFSMSSFRHLDQIIKATTMDNLWVITNGQPYPNPNAILESGYLQALTDHLKNQWSWVLLDCSPVNSCSDSVALACMADGIVLVVRAEKTRWETVRSAQERLQNCGGRILGVVLNKRRFHIPGWIYNRT
jgi:capsular exopolysaccharide synthesis family protein